MVDNIIASRTIDKVTVEVVLECTHCAAGITQTITVEQFKMLISPSRPLMQNIFPEMPPPDRELFISGICRKCWKSLFGAEDTSAESNPLDPASHSVEHHHPLSVGAVVAHMNSTRAAHSHPREDSQPVGTLPATQQVDAVQKYLETCGMPREAFVVAWDGGDYSGVIARVEGYYGKFIGIETTVRDAMQNMANDNFSLCPSRRTGK